MKKVILDNNMKIIGIKNFNGKDRKIDFYLITKENERLYAFSNTYTHHSYDLCKSGAIINEIACKRTRDTGVMRLVKQLNRMLPYLAEIYELPVAA